METVQQEILRKVKKVLSVHPEGEKFFDALDGEIIGKSSRKVMDALFEMVPDKHFLVLSGGFGKRIAKGIDNNEFPSYPYILFNGGIRSGADPTVVRVVNFNSMQKDGIFLDDSIYGGATYNAIQKIFKNKLALTLEKCAVIYDGCPIRKPEISSLFRYYDHFKSSKPNHKF